MSDQDDQLKLDLDKESPDELDTLNYALGGYQPITPRAFDPDMSQVFGIDPENLRSRMKEIDGATNKIEMSQINNPNEFPCDHIPIDVGFAKQKLVCKKCDKEL